MYKKSDSGREGLNAGSTSLGVANTGAPLNMIRPLRKCFYSLVNLQGKGDICNRSPYMTS